MEPFRIAIRASDPGTAAEIRRELETLRGQEPAGAELTLGAAPGTRVLDPQVAMVGLALVSGAATGAGTKLGETLVIWLIDRVRAILQKRKANAELTLAGITLTLDDSCDAEQMASKVRAALGADE